MSGVYGTIKPADIDINNDVEILYHYRPSYNVDDTDFSDFKLWGGSSSELLSPCGVENSGGMSISGLFNLRLPMDVFGKKGIYTIYIRPKEIHTTIMDVGVLSAYPDVRGIIFNTNNIDSNFQSSNALVGYRVEYLDNNKKTNDFKIITSSNLAKAQPYALTSGSDKGVKYTFDMNGSGIFCTVTPSTAPSFKPNSLPNLGYSGDEVVLVNTKFNPIMLEIEMVDHDIDTVTTMLEGNQLIDKDNALITTFNERGEIYHQAEFGVYKDEYGTPLYEYKKTKDDIDFGQNMENLE